MKPSDLLTDGVLDSNGIRRRIHTMFLDSAGISGAIGSRLHDLGFRNVIEVNFGADSPDPKYRNMRAKMWGDMKDFPLTGAIDDNPRLKSDLAGRATSQTTRCGSSWSPKTNEKARRRLT
jgi:hypothetical protein